MRMEIGAEAVEAVIRERDEARRDFESARREGRNAALLTQHRPNVFTQEVANLMPGEPITVRLRYVQAVPRVDGAYELVMPLVGRAALRAAGGNGRRRRRGNRRRRDGRAPCRRRPPPPPLRANGPSTACRAIRRGAVTGMTLPVVGRRGPRVASACASPPAACRSPAWSSRTHRIARDDTGPAETGITPRRGPDGGQPRLRPPLRAGRPGDAGGVDDAHQDQRGGIFSLLVEPPALPDAAEIARARWCSCSTARRR